MTEKKILLLVILSSLVILGGGVLLFNKNQPSSSTITASSQAKMETDSKSFDWGEIKLNSGDAKKTFVLKNVGSEVLKLTNVKTSCTCTTAQVEIEGNKSPLFGMHDLSSWVGEVPVGKSATLEVVFDPAFHGPNGTGPVTRYISVDTNDLQNKTLEFILTGTVVR